MDKKEVLPRVEDYKIKNLKEELNVGLIEHLYVAKI